MQHMSMRRIQLLLLTFAICLLCISDNVIAARRGGGGGGTGGGSSSRESAPPKESEIPTEESTSSAGASSSASEPYESKGFLEVRQQDEQRPAPPVEETWKPLPGEKVTITPLPDRSASREQLLKQTPPDLRFLAILPTTAAAYQRVFEQEYTAKANSEMKTANTKFTELAGEHITILNDNGGKSQLFETIRASSGLPLVVVAHSK